MKYSSKMSELHLENSEGIFLWDHTQESYQIFLIYIYIKICLYLYICKRKKVKIRKKEKEEERVSMSKQKVFPTNLEGSLFREPFMGNPFLNFFPYMKKWMGNGLWKWTLKHYLSIISFFPPNFFKLLLLFLLNR